MCVRAKAARVGTVRYNTAPPPGRRRPGVNARRCGNQRSQDDKKQFGGPRKRKATPHHTKAKRHTLKALKHHPTTACTAPHAGKEEPLTNVREEEPANGRHRKHKKGMAHKNKMSRGRYQKKSADPHWGIASQICTSATWEQNGATGERRHELTYRGIPPIGGTEVHLIIKRNVYSAVSHNRECTAAVYSHTSVLYALSPFL